MDKKFIDKPFKECPGGHYDANGFYITPNGSFWDPDGVYFNSDGVDKHGGYYDDELEYHPGKGWIKELMCYEDEKNAEMEKIPNEEDDDNDDILDEIYMNNNFDAIEEEKTYKKTNVFKPKAVKQKEEKQINPIKEEKEEIITPDMLFNKIPDNKIPKEIKEEQANKTEGVKHEKKIELDSLFN